MSTATASRVVAPRWMHVEELRALRCTPGGPEIDYGMRWGERRDVRASFALYARDAGGYLYAQAETTGTVFCWRRTPRLIGWTRTWRELTSVTAEPDGYLALAALNEQPLSVERAGLLAGALRGAGNGGLQQLRDR